MTENEEKEIQVEINNLLNEWTSLIDFAEDSLYNYEEEDSEENIENMKETLYWLLDHVERFDNLETKIDVLHNKDNIQWN